MQYIYFRCRLQTAHNLIIHKLLGYKVEDKFHLGVCIQKRLNTMIYIRMQHFLHFRNERKIKLPARWSQS
jgi:hypothetical protein